ncbi:toxin [uncultured Herbaspirillum sp.]|uniref:toxin n=1 Tax=uncultured Herbaspirillum sp. TaxID=160236 RepID=UPI00258F796A|nr:toxin [uncultured Herbaspirillum sp.]
MRYIVIGTSGAGKSTFAAALAQTLSYPYIELDQHYWGPNWQAVPPAQFEDAVRQASSGRCWVADGNYSAVRELLWSRATHVVWLNYGRATIARRLLWRTVSRGLLGTRLSHGNRESLRMAFLSRDSILLWAYHTFSKNRDKFAQLRTEPRFAHLQWIELRGPAQAKQLLKLHAR